MSKAKRVIKRSFFVLFITVLALIAGVIWYFIYHDAPILKGEVLYHIKYKDKLTLDIYLPTKEVYRSTPVVVFFHGGAWVMGRKEAININRFNGAINELRRRGYAIVSPEYTLARRGQSPFPSCIDDAIDAFQWVKNNAEKYNFDLDNVGVFGESAGAHISLMSVLSSAARPGGPTIKMDYIIDVYGPTDLQSLYQMPILDSLGTWLSIVPNPLRDNLDITHYLFGFDPSIDSTRTNEFTHSFSPIHHVSELTPPILIIHGNQDRLVPFSQSEGLIEKLVDNNVEYEIHELDKVDHAFINASSDQKKAVQQWITDFIAKQYNE